MRSEDKMAVVARPFDRFGMRVGTNNLPRMLLAVGCTRRTFGNLLRAGQRTMIVVWSTPEEL